MRIQSYQSPTFTAMKPNQFKGFDYACVRKFKAPVEKFENINYFYGWAYARLNELVQSKSGARTANVAERKREMIFEWRNFLGFDLASAPLALIVMASLLKETKSDNDKLPPPLSKNILNETKLEIEERLVKNKDLQFNFKDLYCRKFKEHFIQSEVKNFTGWIKIPSKEHDNANLADNITKLKVLSNKTWCTKAYNADIALDKGDFHVFLENGEAKIGLRFNKDVLTEIQSEFNDGIITPKYFDILDKYVTENKFRLGDAGCITYIDAKIINDELKNINNNLKDSILNKDNYSILRYFDYEPEILADGRLSINAYRQPSEMFDIKELGLTEEALFESVSEIRGNADFSGSNLTHLKGVLRILGDADFCNSNITDLGDLEFIGGNANFNFSLVKSLGNLKEVKGSFQAMSCPLKDLGKLQAVGKNFSINPDIISTCDLRKIGGDVVFTPKSLFKLDKLEEICGDAYFGNNIIDLGRLKSIKGDADFYDANLLKTLRPLEFVGGILYPPENIEDSELGEILCSNIIKGDFSL